MNIANGWDDETLKAWLRTLCVGSATFKEHRRGERISRIRRFFISRMLFGMDGSECVYFSGSDYKENQAIQRLSKECEG